MSGIVGILNIDNKPVETELLRRMTDFMAFRGPDMQQTWHEGYVGFGHTLLRTTIEAQAESQPCSLDGEVWITADARIDGRSDLIRQLQAKGRVITKTATDAELILHAYHSWAEACVEYLIGDFAFAIWDARQRRLFCGRDQLGVKPFYYAHLADCFIFSNTLNCVRRHPKVSARLNEQAIGDFLLSSRNRNLATTTFADIQRLPPAHYLTWHQGRCEVHRYWQFSDQVNLQYRRKEEYIERFLELLDTAVSDRLRTNRIAVSMSGGLDSTSITAVAKKLLAQQFPEFNLEAHCTVVDRIFPNQERHYTGIAAESIGIPIHFLAVDDYMPYQRWENNELNQPEPVHNPLLAVSDDFCRQLAQNSRVELTGWDGDTVMSASPFPYFRYLFKGSQWRHLLVAGGSYAWMKKSRLPAHIQIWLRRIKGNNEEKLLDNGYPQWINRDFEKKLDLPARWVYINDALLPIHPVRSSLCQILTSTAIVDLFESYDPGVTLQPMESRHPLVDLRLVNFLLEMPPVPWFLNKHLLRISMRGILPEAVRQRPKSPLSGDQVVIYFRNEQEKIPDIMQPMPELGQYVEMKDLSHLTGERDRYRLWINLRPITLNYWLRDLHLRRLDYL